MLRPETIALASSVDKIAALQLTQEWDGSGPLTIHWNPEAPPRTVPHVVRHHLVVPAANSGV